MSNTTINTKPSLMDKMTDVINNKIAPPLIRLSQIRYLDSLQKAFITLMPYLILGATATLVLNLGGLFAEGTGLNLPNVQASIDSFIEPLRPWLTQIVFVTINLLALLISLLNSYFLGQYYEKVDQRITPIGSALVSLIGFLCFVNFTELSANFDWPAYILGSPSLFTAILLSIVSTEIYRFLIQKNITIKMPEGVPPMVTAAFTSMIPVFVIIILFSIIGQGFSNFNLLTIFNEYFSYLVSAGSGPIAQGLGFITDRLLWFVGIHGSNVVSSVMYPVWTSMITDNISAFANNLEIPYMFTEQWVNVYVRTSVLPIAILLIFSKVERFKVLGKLGLPGAIFNIAEPIMFGLPLVLNPLMFVPWVLGFAGLYVLYSILGVIGITPPMVAYVVWTMPPPLAAFIGSGFNVLAFILSLLSMVLLYFIFLPFFRALEKQEILREEQDVQESQNKDINTEEILV